MTWKDGKFEQQLRKKCLGTFFSVPFYRFRHDEDPNAEKKKIWAEKLNGAFTVGVSYIARLRDLNI
jgi:hypothetical protein